MNIYSYTGQVSGDWGASATISKTIILWHHSILIEKLTILEDFKVKNVLYLQHSSGRISGLNVRPPKPKPEA